MKIFTKVLVLVFVFLYSVCGVFAASSEDIKQNIIRQARLMGVEPAIALSIAKTESGFRQDVTSAGGNIGVFQLAPATARNMGLNPYDLNDNIKGGITYYKNMYNKFGSMELAVAAYQTGPLTISRNNNKIPSYSQAFVARIMKDYRYYKSTGL